MRESICLIILLAVVSAMPVAQAAAEGADAQQAAGPAAGQSTATGEVIVYLEEWQPDLSGMGAGLFTFTAFDFSGFFEELAGSLSSLLFPA